MDYNDNDVKLSFHYLNQMSQSMAVNMFEASRRLSGDLGYHIHVARELTRLWMKDRKSNKAHSKK